MLPTVSVSDVSGSCVIISFTRYLKSVSVGNKIKKKNENEIACFETRCLTSCLVRKHEVIYESSYVYFTVCCNSVITLLIIENNLVPFISIQFVAEEYYWRCKDSLSWSRLAAFSCRLRKLSLAWSLFNLSNSLVS